MQLLIIVVRFVTAMRRISKRQRKSLIQHKRKQMSCILGRFVQWLMKDFFLYLGSSFPLFVKKMIEYTQLDTSTDNE